MYYRVGLRIYGVKMSRVKQKQRFEFGKNWENFLKNLDDEKINASKDVLQKMLKVETLKDKTFLDIGCGSGLHSLSARMLGAKVHSFDYDVRSVNCTRFLKEKFFNSDGDWKVEEGSALDERYISSLGKFDIVYSWGVLHHTGDMWNALDLASVPVNPDGILYIAIYNDQGRPSRYWYNIKRIFNLLPKYLRIFILLPVFIRLWGPTTIRDILKGKPFLTWRYYYKSRGMTPWINVVDWVGGYPFEVAKPERIFYFFQNKGFRLNGLTTCGGGHGCNEFVFQRIV